MAKPEKISYRHTQTGPLSWLMLALFAAMVVVAVALRDQGPVWILLLVISLVFLVFTFTFRSLTVADEGEALLIQYGPLPLFRKRLQYNRIVSAEQGRTSLIDGIGIHYVPGRGWTYNIWGWECVKCTTDRGVIRIGSNDAKKLAKFLNTKIGGPAKPDSKRRRSRS